MKTSMKKTISDTQYWATKDIVGDSTLQAMTGGTYDTNLSSIGVGEDCVITINARAENNYKYYALGVEPVEGRTYQLVCSKITAFPNGIISSQFKLV